jgi:hypothetical protein
MALKFGLVTAAALLMTIPPVTLAQGRPGLPPDPIRRESSRQAAKERAARLKPILARLAVNDFSGALKAFRSLDAIGPEHFTPQEARCLLHLSRSREGLTLLAGPKGADLNRDQRVMLQAALAISAHDPKALEEAYRSRPPSIHLRPATGEPMHEPVNPNPPPDPNRDLPHFLMRLAWQFGGMYDREAMHLLADEGMRRGATDVSSLLQYAALCADNADFTQAMGLCKRAVASAKTREERTATAESVSRMQSLIYQLTRTQSLAQVEEARRKQYRSTYFLRSW